MFESPLLDLADQTRRLRALPPACVTMLLRATDPPALARQPVGLSHDEYRELGLAARFGFVVDISEHLAQGAHLGAAEMVAEQLQHFGVADRLASLGRGDHDRPDLGRIGEQSGFAHCGCWLKSTGVSSNTSSFDVLCGHGIT